MDRIWTWLILILFQISFFIGVCHFREGKYLVFDGVLFCVSIVWFGGCTIRQETNNFMLSDTHSSFRLCVIFYSLFTVNIFLFLSLINFHLKNNQFFKLISFHRELGIINSQIRDRRSGRRLLNVIAVIGFQLLSGVLFLYREETASTVDHKIYYDRLCATTMTWPTTILCFQFSCWVQIFTFNFELVLENVQSKMTSAMPINAKCLSDSTLSKLNNDLKIVMRLKQAITESYGSGIVFNQLYTFICLLLNYTLLIYVEYGGSRRKQIIWYRYYFVARIIYYLVLSYIPHRIGQTAFSEVSIGY